MRTTAALTMTSPFRGCVMDFTELEATLATLKGAIDNLEMKFKEALDREILAHQILDAVDKLTGLTTFWELKYRKEDGKGNLHRPAYYYGYCEGENEDGIYHLEAEGAELSVVLHGLIGEIEAGAPNADVETGYAYLAF